MWKEHSNIIIVFNCLSLKMSLNDHQFIQKDNAILSSTEAFCHVMKITALR